MTIEYIIFSFQDPQRFTQIWIFGLKTYHLATLHLTRRTFLIFRFFRRRKEKIIKGRGQNLKTENLEVALKKRANCYFSA
jgi:hypothetical protein